LADIILPATVAAAAASDRWSGQSVGQREKMGRKKDEKPASCPKLKEHVDKVTTQIYCTPSSVFAQPEQRRSLSQYSIGSIHSVDLPGIPASFLAKLAAIKRQNYEFS